MFDKIRKVLRWLPVLWNDKDWDYSYLLTMVQKKSQELAECIKTDEYHESSEEICEEIYRFLSHIDKFSDPIKYLPCPPDAQSWFEDIPNSRNKSWKCNEKMTQWAKEVGEFEEEQWNLAWDLFREKARGWWC